jgi:hypothetical protein
MPFSYETIQSKTCSSQSVASLWQNDFFGIVIKEAQSPASVDIRGQQQLSKMNDIKRARQPLFILLQVCVMCSQHLIKMLLN